MQQNSGWRDLQVELVCDEAVVGTDSEKNSSRAPLLVSIVNGQSVLLQAQLLLYIEVTRCKTLASSMSFRSEVCYGGIMTLQGSYIV